MPLSSTKLPLLCQVVPKEGFEPTHPCGYYALNVARLPFRHFGTMGVQSSPRQLSLESRSLTAERSLWWAVEDLNLGPLACEASALTG